MLLTTAAALSLVIYSIRRHKLDDFHGRYRLWLWAAGCWMLMSMDESGSLHEGFKELMTQLTGQRIMGDGSIWWVGAYLLILGTVSVRVLLDIRRSKAATAAFVGVGLCFVTAIAAQMQLLMPETGARGVMLEEGCEMVGYVLLVISLSLFARHVILDANGGLPKERSEPREPKTKAAGTVAATTTTAKRDDLATTAKNRTLATPPAAPQAKSLVDDYEELYDEDDDRARNDRRNRQVRVDGEESIGERRKLSKADRKAMRREKERYRRGDE
jgi:hypothetical protein